MDIKLLKDLIQFYSVYKTEDEKKIHNYIINFLKEENINYTTLDNNIMSFNYEDKPLLSAHLDIVNTNGPSKHIINYKNVLYGFTENYERTSLGGDDKCGVFIILSLLKMGYKFNFIISEGEEAGLIGIKKCEKIISEKIEELDIPYAIVLDRRGFKEILDSGASGKYCDTLAKCLRNYIRLVTGETWSLRCGSSSDTNIIRRYVESVNISTAYYNAHSKFETINIEELEKLLNIMEMVLSDFVFYGGNFDEYQTVYTPKSFYDSYR